MKTRIAKAVVWCVSLFIVVSVTPSCSNLDPNGSVLPGKGDLNFNWDSYPVSLTADK